MTTECWHSIWLNEHLDSTSNSSDTWKDYKPSYRLDYWVKWSVHSPAFTLCKSHIQCKSSWRFKNCMCIQSCTPLHHHPSKSTVHFWNTRQLQSIENVWVVIKVDILFIYCFSRMDTLSVWTQWYLCNEDHPIRINLLANHSVVFRDSIIYLCAPSRLCILV